MDGLKRDSIPNSARHRERGPQGPSRSLDFPLSRGETWRSMSGACCKAFDTCSLLNAGIAAAVAMDAARAHGLKCSCFVVSHVFRPDTARVCRQIEMRRRPRRSTAPSCVPDSSGLDKPLPQHVRVSYVHRVLSGEIGGQPLFAAARSRATVVAVSPATFELEIARNQIVAHRR